MKDKQSIVTCLHGVGVVFSLVLINDIYHARWFDVMLILIFIVAILVTTNKIQQNK